MAVNDLTFNQLSTVLNAIVAQASGKTEAAPMDTYQFVSVAQRVLKTGYDPLLTAVTQVLGKTIFSVRPYTAKFRGMRVTNQKWGSITRKLNILDSGFEDDERFLLEDGEAVDQQIVRKPTIAQTNFYGANVYSLPLTVYKDQLDNAFTGPEQFREFIGMLMSNVSDRIEQKHEVVARATLINLILGLIAAAAEDKPKHPERVVHLLTEFNAKTGNSYTTDTIYEPEAYSQFMKYVAARVRTISDLLTERSVKYHTGLLSSDGTNQNNLMRHTPYQRQKMYLFTPEQYLTETEVLSSLYNADYVKMTDFERVNFWQSIDSPDFASGTPIYLDEDTGNLTTPEEAIEQANIFGVIFDEEAAGITTMSQWSASSPFNARGGYTNTFWHFTDRYWNDFSENAVVFLLD